MFVQLITITSLRSTLSLWIITTTNTIIMMPTPRVCFEVCALSIVVRDWPSTSSPSPSFQSVLARPIYTTSEIILVYFSFVFVLLFCTDLVNSGDRDLEIWIGIGCLSKRNDKVRHISSHKVGLGQLVHHILHRLLF